MGINRPQLTNVRRKETPTVKQRVWEKTLTQLWYKFNNTNKNCIKLCMQLWCHACDDNLKIPQGKKNKNAEQTYTTSFLDHHWASLFTKQQCHDWWQSQPKAAISLHLLLNKNTLQHNGMTHHRQSANDDVLDTAFARKLSGRLC